MPAICIQSLPGHALNKRQEIMKSIARDVAEIAKVPERAVFCTWQVLEAGAYIQNGEIAESQPENSHPPIVTLTLFEGRSAEQIEQALNAIAKHLSSIGNVFISVHEAKSGEVFTGGGVRKKS
jgi:phenylpyruvate tautomerase PptA (4-oxalocrotonate tautomerase family)